ncbi:hypothetical protein GCM10023190_17280 [Enteractinococcus fodinae]|uniref:2'-5' RNA ligase n=1 Tax=Enteractinococcus fodinae TaxID=684663 RepID=A0ABU2AWR7_9MICC|nr:2'-5' RNA ligase family protein [Enteractinococcus fodinae]MDR7345802.1 2'-5' RNA ligase [Enteractinococcus fodinae]
MSRYFIGLMVPARIQDQLTTFARTIQATLPDQHPYQLSWNAPADLHCTLLYVGPTDEETHLRSEMHRIAAHVPPATITISGVTHWLGRNSLALAATGAELAGTRFINELAHLSSDARAGTRPFYGHVTLGRVRPVPTQGQDPFVGHDIEPLAWTATSVQLVKSQDQPGPRRYQIVSDARFGG